MAMVTISINSREYAIACEDGQELRIIQLSKILDEKAKLLTDGSTQISENMLLAMISLLLADELSELKKNRETDDHTPNYDFSNLQMIDKELASLIKSLNKKLKSLANEINVI
jgi:cell division protein ZapA